ncbi:MAG: hypothetical protein AAGI53_14555 [Planctomycetota bacterium]
MRAKGPYAKACHECGYDLPDAEPGDRCPECGTVFTGELPSPGSGPASSVALGSSVVALVMAFVPILVIPTVFSAFVAMFLCGFVLKHTHPDRRPAARHVKRA